jgi:hypothetical protein
MTSWTSDEINKIGTAEELQIASLGGDGTLRKPVIIWVVRLGDDLYVRSYRGRGGTWFRGTQESGEGRIWSVGVEKDVNFVEETDPGINEKIDQLYLTKYRHHAAIYVDPMVASEARAATLKLVPK